MGSMENTSYLTHIGRQEDGTFTNHKAVIKGTGLTRNGGRDSESRNAFRQKLRRRYIVKAGNTIIVRQRYAPSRHERRHRVMITPVRNGCSKALF